MSEHASALPASVVILGIPYTITYVKTPSEVDIYKRKSLWGQIDYWTRTIRVYDNDLSVNDIWETIIHETLHGIAEALHLESLQGDEDDLGILALGLTDTLIRNGWLNPDPDGETLRLAERDGEYTTGADDA